MHEELRNMHMKRVTNIHRARKIIKNGNDLQEQKRSCSKHDDGHHARTSKFRSA